MQLNIRRKGAKIVKQRTNLTCKILGEKRNPVNLRAL